VLLLSALQFAGFRLRCAHTVRANLLKLRSEVVKEEEKEEEGRAGAKSKEKGKKAAAAVAAVAARAAIGSAPLLVLRGGAWRPAGRGELVPGDVLALRGRAGQRSEAPADCLVLWGQAVVDEAILTGESLPQLKGPPSLAVSAEEEKDGRLDMEGRHRPHVLFSGTRVVRIEEGQQAAGAAGAGALFPSLPEGEAEGGGGPWLVARVLRTGYFSTQVKREFWIDRMIN
jgi:magnesium-transporting ATPase (P-type)